jgi:hypothetical protein
VKARDEFDNDPIQFYVSNTQKMKVEHKIKDIRNVFLPYRL